MIIEVTATVVAGLFTILGIYFKYYLKDKEKNDIEYELTNHALFSRIDYLLSKIDYSLEFDDEGRYKLVTDVMEKYFYIVKKELYKLAEEVEKKSKEGNEFNVYDIHVKTLNKIIREYTDINNYNNNNLDDESKLTLKLFLNKFQKWHNDRNIFLKERSAEISGSNFYKKEEMKVSVLFDVYIGILASTLQDGSKTLQELNGELNGKKYKGSQIRGE